MEGGGAVAVEKGEGEGGGKVLWFVGVRSVGVVMTEGGLWM